MKNKTKKSTADQPNSKKVPEVFVAAADAAIEIGQAAQDLKSSWEHVKKAQTKGERAVKPVVRTGRKVVKTVTRATKKAVKRR